MEFKWIVTPEQNGREEEKEKEQNGGKGMPV